MTPSEWLYKFLSFRELQEPTGEILCKYKVRDHEFAFLEEVLKANTVNTIEWDTCFVLYATEWWRREYSGGHWSWEPILNRLNQRIQVADRNKIIESGFSKWRRNIYKSQSGRDFIGTVVVECGIPLNILQEDHYLAGIISETYREVGEISSIGYEYFDLVRSIANRKRLPETLNKEPFIQLILETVQKLVKLNHEFELSKHESPVTFLDSQYSTWREEFPVRIDNGVAKKFLDNLLSEVSKIEMPSGSTISISMICELECKESTWQPVSYLSIKSGIHKYQNLGLKEDIYNQLSNKAEIFIDDEKGERRIGFAFKVSQKDGFRIDGLDKYRLIDNNPFSLFLSDSKSGQRIDVETPINILSFDEPLIFSQKESKWVLKTSGSTKVPAATYRIIVKADSLLTCKEFEVIGLLPESKKIIEIRSECEIQDDDNLYKIRFSDQSQTYRYEFHPSDNYRTIDFYRKDNQNVYLGFPKIYQFDENGNLSSRIISGVEYNNGQQWKRLNPNEKIVGNLRVRLSKDGETLFCRALSILPRDFKIEFINTGANSSTRKVTIHNTSGLLLTIRSQVQSRVHAEHQDRHIIEFSESAGDDIPESFGMKLQNNAHSDEVELRIPYPLNEFYFYDTSGQILNNRQNLFLQKLHSVRLAIPNLNNAVTNTLQLKLVDRFLNEAVQIGKPIKKELLSSNIPLIRFQDQISKLFSLTENIDARVEVSCQQQLIEIRQFSSKPRFIIENKTVSIKTTDAEVDTVDVKAFRLDLPFSKDLVINLNHVDNGEWELPEGEGVWLIYPGHESSQLFRPIAYKTITKERAEVLKVEEIHQAAIFSTEQRLEAIGLVIDEMCVEFNHADWNRLHELHKETKHLPLATIDAWKAFARHELGLIGLVFRLPQEIIRQLTDELSIIWHQIPIDKWIECFGRYENYVQEHYPEQSKLLLNSTLDHVENMLELPSVRWILEGKNEGIPSNIGLINHLIDIQLNGEQGRSGVKARHNHEKWPDQLKDKLISSFIQIPRDIRHLLPAPQDIPQYQQPVIYLPFVLAVASTTSLIQLPEFSTIERFRMMEIIGFDETWFKNIYSYIRGYAWIQFPPNKVTHE